MLFLHSDGRTVLLWRQALCQPADAQLVLHRSPPSKPVAHPHLLMSRPKRIVVSQFSMT